MLRAYRQGNKERGDELHQFTGPVDCFVLSDEAVMPFDEGLVIVGVIGHPEFITCCSTRCIGRYFPRVTAMVSSKLICDYVPHHVATADWAVRFIDCSEAIGHEMANTTSGGRHRGVVLGETGNLALVVLFTTAKKRLTGVPLWQGSFSSPSNLVPGCTRPCWALASKVVLVSKTRFSNAIKHNGQPVIWRVDLNDLKKAIVEDIASLIF